MNRTAMINLTGGLEPMPKYCPENEKMKRAYSFFLEAADGKQSPTIDAALRAIDRFETSTNRKPFRKFNPEQARSFRTDLFEETGPRGNGLSAATITSTLKHLRNFFLWLSREPGFRAALNANDAKWFNPSEQDQRIAGARRERPVPTLADIKATLARMPCNSHVQKRDRAVLAFAILSGARDGAIATFRLKHVNLAAQTVFQDGRDVKTKGRKTFRSWFFPVGPEPLEIFADYYQMLKDDLGFGPDDPLFPSTAVGHGPDRGFEAQGLSRQHWSSTEPIRRIFRAAFAAAGLPTFNPHSLRKTLALHADSLNLTREEEKAYSQNFGHESIWTTRESYGTLPEHRQAEVMRRLGEPITGGKYSGLDIAALESFINSAKGSRVTR